MDRKEIISFLGEEWDRTIGLIRSSVRSDIGLLDSTNAEILEHSGKLLRPMLSLLTAKAFCEGRLPEDSIRFAAASELLHNATLLHDDVADASSTRRGYPTVGSLLGSTASVLVGDFWLVKAMDNILSADRNFAEVTGIFSKTLTDLAEGEMLQLEKSFGGDSSEADYLKIIFNKTASVFEAACLSAAISVGASDKMREAVREYAVNLGLAFQIKDDILDYEGGDIGKPAGMDLKERKITLPLLGALGKVSEEREKLVRKMVCEIPSHPEYCDEILDFVNENGGLEYARAELVEYASKAVEAIGKLPASKAADCLRSVADFFVIREK